MDDVTFLRRWAEGRGADVGRFMSLLNSGIHRAKPDGLTADGKQWLQAVQRKWDRKILNRFATLEDYYAADRVTLDRNPFWPGGRIHTGDSLNRLRLLGWIEWSGEPYTGHYQLTETGLKLAQRGGPVIASKARTERHTVELHGWWWTVADAAELQRQLYGPGGRRKGQRADRAALAAALVGQMFSCTFDPYQEVEPMREGRVKPEAKTMTEEEALRLGATPESLGMSDAQAAAKYPWLSSKTAPTCQNGKMAPTCQNGKMAPTCQNGSVPLALAKVEPTKLIILDDDLTPEQQTKIKACVQDILADEVKMVRLLENCTEIMYRQGQQLLKLKEIIGHGRFGAWQAAGLPFSPRTARERMALARGINSHPNRSALLKMSPMGALETLGIRKHIKQPEPRAYSEEFPGLSPEPEEHVLEGPTPEDVAAAKGIQRLVSSIKAALPAPVEPGTPSTSVPAGPKAYTMPLPLDQKRLKVLQKLVKENAEGLTVTFVPAPTVKPIKVRRASGRGKKERR